MLGGPRRAVRHSAKGDDVSAQLLDRSAMTHGRLPDQCERVGFGQIVALHDLQHGREHKPTRADPHLQSIEVVGFLGSALDRVKGDNKRSVKSSRAQRLDQERSGLQLKQPLQAARRLGSDQGDDRRTCFPHARQVRFDGNGISIEYDDVIAVLEAEGVQKFEDSYAQLADSVKSQLAQADK